MPDGGKDHSGAIAPPPIIYLLGFGLGYLIHTRYPLWLPNNGLIDFIGGLLVGVAIALSIVSVSELSSASTAILPYSSTTSIVKTGAFHYSRNPIYVAMTLGYIGVSILFKTLWPLILLPIVVLVMDRGVIAREERYLSRKFGEEYDEYRAKVRRWI